MSFLATVPSVGFPAVVCIVRIYSHVVSIQLFLFGNRFQEAVCPVFRNITFVKAFVVDGVLFSPVINVVLDTLLYESPR